MIKILNKLDIEANFLNTRKRIYEKSTANIQLRSGTRKACPLLPLVFDSVLEVLARQLGKKKK